MRLITPILLCGLASCSLWMTSCAGLKPAPLHDSNLPLLEVYDKDGNRLEGYEAHASGYVANVVKRCDAILERLEKAR